MAGSQTLQSGVSLAQSKFTRPVPKGHTCQAMPTPKAASPGPLQQPGQLPVWDHGGTSLPWLHRGARKQELLLTAKLQQTFPKLSQAGSFGIMVRTLLRKHTSHILVSGFEFWLHSGFQLPANVHPGKQQVMAAALSHGDTCARPGLSPDPWLQPGPALAFCKHLGSEPVKGRELCLSGFK